MDATFAVIGGLVSGALGGLVLSLLGWLESGDNFNVRKNIASILLATMTGLVTTVALVQTDIFTNPATPNWQLIVAFVTIFGAAAGFGQMGRKAVNASTSTTTVTDAAAPAAAAATDATNAAKTTS